MSFKELEQLVSNRDLEIVYIVSPPRTISTVFSIALTEAGEGQIHEPLHPRRRDSFDEACSLIIERSNNLQIGKKKDAPVRLVVKDLAKYISRKEWEQLSKLSQHFVFTVREPTLQFFSLLRRRVHGLYGYHLDDLSNDQVLAHLDRLTEDKWHDNSWNQLELFLKFVEQEDLSDKGAIISGLSLRLDPLNVMRRLSERFDWMPFNPRLADNWSRASGPNFYHPPFKNDQPMLDKDRVIISGWITPALKSSSFLPLGEKDRPIPITSYPQPMQQYILNEVFPVYVRMLTHPLNISRPSFSALQKPINQEGHTLGDINPIETYILVSGYGNLDQEGEQQRQAMVRELEEKLQTEHPLLFDRLSSLTSENIGIRK